MRYPTPLLFTLIVTALVSCGTDPLMDSSPRDSVPQVDSALQETGLPHGESWWSTTHARIGADLRAIRLVPGIVDTYRSENPFLGIQSGFDTDGAWILADDHGLRLRLSSWGRNGYPQGTDTIAPSLGECAGELDPAGQCVRRLEYDHEGLVEWWVNREDGLEHGFTVDERPFGKGDLVFTVEVRGADLEVDASGETAWLTDEAGHAWRYEGPLAWDSHGNPLPAILEEGTDGILIVVDDAGATWPITVDPILTTAATTLTAPSASSNFGISIHAAGNVNGDVITNASSPYYNNPLSDVIIGASAYNSGQGRVYVFHGTASGLSTTAATILTGENTGDLFGFSVGRAGFVNGDTYADLIVGAYGYSSEKGRAYVFHGSSTGIASGSASSANTILTGPAASRFGFSVSTAGNVNRGTTDTWDDVIVGAPYPLTTNGKAHVFHGSGTGIASRDVTVTPADSLVVGAAIGSGFGFSVSDAGNSNRSTTDTFDDVVVGAPYLNTNRGAAYYYLGTATGVGTLLRAYAPASTNDAFCGWAVSGMGDINADGFDDFMIGVPGYISTIGANSGRVYYYVGSASGPVTASANRSGTTAINAYFGATISDIGDINHDGFADVAMSGYGPLGGSQSVWIYEGRLASNYLTPASNGTIPTLTSTTGSFGTVIAGLGDVNGDLYSDMAVGNLASETVYVYHGRSTTDADSDGHFVPQDCNDANAAINPAAVEIAGDGIDQNCDGAELCYQDADDDNYRPDSTSTITSSDADCTDSMEALATDPVGDCDDFDPAILPGAPDTTADGIDSDCDGDELCHVDADDDGYRLSTTLLSTDTDCVDPGEALATDPTNECNDSDPTIHPNATDAACDGIDQDCDGQDAGSFAIDWCTIQWPYTTSTTTVAPTEWIYGRAYVAGVTGNSGSHSSCLQAQLCYGADGTDPATDSSWSCASGSFNAWYGNDDEYMARISSTTAGTYDYAWRFSGSAGLSWVYCDTGGSGSSDPYSIALAGSLTVSGCADADSDGYSASTCGGTDCDDSDGAIHPGATEMVGDETDQDCDALETCYVDADDDGYRLTAVMTSSDPDCTDSGEARALEPGGDCNDAIAQINPAATEYCNSIDDNCDGTTDEASAADAQTWHADADSDAYGNATVQVVACTAPGGHVLDATDCDDGTPLVHPNATEILANGVDENCDGLELCFADGDVDGYRSEETVPSSDSDCVDAGEALQSNPAGDCNDSSDTIHPNATETIGDGIDEDCDLGEICFADTDNDGWRVSTTLVSSDSDCLDSGEAMASDPAPDCDDAQPAIYPGAPENTGDEGDQDCDGTEICFVDADDDGWRIVTTVVSTDLDCTDPGEARAGESEGDCDDESAMTHPGATELTCDGIDQDCDGIEAGSFSIDWCNVQWPLSTSSYTGFPTPSIYGQVYAAGITGSAGSHSSCLEAELCFGPDGTNPATNTSWSCGIGAFNVYTGNNDEYRSTLTVSTAGIYDYAWRFSGSAGLSWTWCDTSGSGPTDPYRIPSAGDLVVSACPDADSDGFQLSSCGGSDCDDLNDLVFPGATEYCNNIDDNCNGTIDESSAVGAPTWYRDLDADGYGDPSATNVACNQPTGYVSGSTDCNDASTAIHPSATEIVADGIDQDCSGGDTCYIDTDHDGYGATGTVVSSDLDCSDTGEAPTSTDCSDSTATIHPGATEGVGDGVDQNCDGQETCYVDSDNDGYRLTTTLISTDTDCGDSGEALASDATGECNDANAAVHPGATEYCNGQDDDCDGTTDESSAADVVTWYRDSDVDGYGSLSSTTAACTQPTGYVADSTDCNDAAASIHPGATETIGNGVDESCDGQETCYTDADDDGYRVSTTRASTDPDCSDSGEALASEPAGDCDDVSATVHPNATEIVADGIDQSCDGLETCYADADNDNYRTTTTLGSTDTDCSDSGEALASEAAGDCNDNAATVHPNATETVADGIDQDCNGQETCYADADSDSYRTSTMLTSTDADCSDTGEALVSMSSGDCDDTRSSVHPGAVETCNSLDDNCDGTVDETTATDAPTWYRDSDGDSYGNVALTTRSCAQPTGYVASSTDCNDAAATIFPGATEVVADGVDQSCDGQETCYADADDDGYRTTATLASSDVDCTDSGEALASDPGSDCNDTVAAIHPNATEVVADGIDQNCDGLETCYTDADNDGYRISTTRASADSDCTDSGEALASVPTGDCNDAVAAIHPNVTEVVADGIDQNCDGLETCYTDADDDGYRISTTRASTDPDCLDSGEALATEPGNDCDDTAAAIHPSATEIVADGVDQDCDGQESCYTDADGDSYRTATTLPSTDADCSDIGEALASMTSGDCDDTRASVHPGAIEYCNSLDDNCDGTIDEATATDAPVWYRDFDSDGYGNVAPTTRSCSQPTGYVANSTDCNDAAARVYPGATEVIADGVDQSCDGQETCFADSDADGYRTTGTVSSSDVDCTDSGEALATVPPGDCNDADATIHPNAAEAVADGIDQNCDGQESCYADADDDGYRTTNSIPSSDADCADTGEALATDPSGDCNDAYATIHPNATEIEADGIDQSCDGQEICYTDADDDGYRISTTRVSTDSDCGDSGEALASEPGSDCNDTEASIHPNATELVADGIDQTCDGQETCYADADDDGFHATSTVISSNADCADPGEALASEPAGDCDDDMSTVFPGALEYCNGIDDNCDGTIDENSAVDVATWYLDADSDNYGDASYGILACSPPSGHVADATDCDDRDASVHPGASELIGDGFDQDCDGQELCYLDADRDGYRIDSTMVSVDIDCADPGEALTTMASGDCDDTRAFVNPSATESCNAIDDDCDGTIDENDIADALTWYADADLDGFGDPILTIRACEQPSGYVADATDCDDASSAIFPGAIEVPGDGTDQDCDNQELCYAEIDGDGYRADATISSTDTDCLDAGEAMDSVSSGDCDDSLQTVHPNADEHCNRIDDNCDGSIDEDSSIDALTWYRDADGDGAGDIGSTTVACTQPGGYVMNADDCDDLLASVYPGAIEICNDVDDDCDGATDEAGAIHAPTWFMDADGDGYGDAMVSTVACTQPSSSHVSDSTDCDDTRAAVRPGATEICNSIDDDCDSTIDEPDAVGAPIWYLDLDGDGWGIETGTTTACSLPVGYAPYAGDCDDADSRFHPGAAETDCADANDYNCDGSVGWVDADNDGYAACEECDDLDDDVHPNATEFCNGIDDDCDLVVDESDSSDASMWHADADGDGYGSPTATTPACTQPMGHVADGTDCDDTRSLTHPDATELCNSIDDDCDNQVDNDASDLATWYADADSDGFGDPTISVLSCTKPAGYGADSTDCDDINASVYPGATEQCDTLDNDCDGQVDELAANATIWYVDLDSDGWGNPGVTLVSCAQPVGYVARGPDCDDQRADMNPEAPETCDGSDNDCDGVVDGPKALDAFIWYADSDADTYGDAASIVTDCTQPAGFVSDDTDCDDTRADTHPQASELCDGVDNDCDSEVDEGAKAVVWYADQDGDGFGDPATSVDSCVQPVGYVDNSLDCDDLSTAVNPDAAEICDDIDNDCDSEIDESATDAPTWYADLDADGYGDATAPLIACDQAVDTVADATDCDDSDATVHPGGDDVPGDGIDQDCDGSDAGGADDTSGDTGGDGKPGKGCACSSTGTGSLTFAGLLLASLGLVVSRRRRLVDLL